MTIDGHTYPAPSPFMVLATQNPVEMAGTYPLPEAQLDRFIFKLDVKFPEKSELLDIVKLTTGKGEARAQKLFDGNKIKEMRDISLDVPVADAVADYAMDVIIRSHPEIDGAPEAVKKYVRYGSSPRGAQAIIKTRFQSQYTLMAPMYRLMLNHISPLVAPWSLFVLPVKPWMLPLLGTATRVASASYTTVEKCISSPTALSTTSTVKQKPLMSRRRSKMGARCSLYVSSLNR